MSKNIENHEEKENKTLQRMAEVEAVMQKGKTQQRINKLNDVMKRAKESQKEKTIKASAKYTPVIGLEQINKAKTIFNSYKSGKTNHDDRIVNAEKWYSQKVSPPLSQEGVQRSYSSSWLFNALHNKHSDFMDNYPEPTVLAREKGDEKTADMLSSILPVIFEQNKFKRIYSKNCWNKISYGVAAYGVFWNPSKLNGLGDIDIKKLNILNIFWEPGVENIQDSPHLFIVSNVNNEELEALYPQLKDKLNAAAGGDTRDFETDDRELLENKSTVYDWYYKKKNSAGKTVLHYVRWCEDEVLYATENIVTPIKNINGEIIKDAPCETGLYQHGKYPIVLDALFPIEHSPSGTGWIDKLADAQEQIDILNNAILINAKLSAMKRWAISNDAKINEKEFADWTKMFVHVTDGNFNENTATEITSKPLDSVVISVLDRKIDELKETGSNRDFANGASSGGVTSGAAIAALQEAGNKTSRDQISTTYDAIEEVTELVIENIREFYNSERCFRIIGEDGKAEYTSFNNKMLKPVTQVDAFGQTIGQRTPVFDVKVKIHKQNPFSRVAQNQDMINFYSMGFFNPANADQSLACIEMIEMENKERLREKIQKNGTLYDLVQKMQPILAQIAIQSDERLGTNWVQHLGSMGLLGNISSGILGAPNRSLSAGGTNPLGELLQNSGHPTVDNAKRRTAAATEQK